MRKPLSAPRGGVLLGHVPALRRDPLAFLTRCARDYGSVAPLRLFSIPTLLLLDSEDIERVLVTDHHNFVKPIWLRTAAVRRLLGDGLVTTDGDEWRRQRRECQAAFHPHLLPAYGETFAKLTARMLGQWRDGQRRDVRNDMARLTLEIVAETMLGRDISDRAGEIGEAMDTIMACFGSKYRLFGMIPLPPSRRESRAIGRLNALVDQLIAEHRNEGGEAGAAPLITSLLNDPDQNAARVREQVKTFLAAGHESSALALTWAFLMLARHPGADARLALELNTVLGGRSPTREDLPNLPYTLAIVKETLRLYPPLWMIGRTVVNECEIGGFRAPRASADPHQPVGGASQSAILSQSRRICSGTLAGPGTGAIAPIRLLPLRRRPARLYRAELRRNGGRSSARDDRSALPAGLLPGLRADPMGHHDSAAAAGNRDAAGRACYNERIVAIRGAFSMKDP